MSWLAGKDPICEPLKLLISQLLTSILRRAHCPALLEALSAKDRPSLRWPEGDSGLLPALGATGFRLRACRRGVTAAALSPLGLASLASLRFVFEAFVGEKHLFAGGKHELCTALCTLQHLIVVFHESLSPWSRVGQGIGRTLHLRA